MLWISLGLNWALGLGLVVALLARAAEAQRARRAERWWAMTARWIEDEEQFRKQ